MPTRLARRGQRPTDGFVYAVTNPAWPGYVKFGKAVSLEKRLGQYNTGDPFRQYRLLWAVRVQCPASAERHLQRIARPFHEKGEWYKLAEQAAVNLMETYLEEHSIASR